MTAFGGFSDEALGFYDGLEADNSKSYWLDHKALYDHGIREPLLALLAAVEPEFGPGKLFRPYRDVRFSADKSPYKTQQGAVVGTGTAQGPLYVQVSAEGLMTGGGFYLMAPDQLARYRAAVLDDVWGPRLVRIAQALTKRGFRLAGEQLKRVPRGVDAAHPRADLLRHKGIAALREHGAPAWLSTAKALDHIVADWRALNPLVDWLDSRVGPADPRPRT